MKAVIWANPEYRKWAKVDIGLHGPTLDIRVHPNFYVLLTGVTSIEVSDRHRKGFRRHMLKDYDIFPETAQGQLMGKKVFICYNGLSEIGFKSKRVFYVKVNR